MTVPAAAQLDRLRRAVRLAAGLPRYLRAPLDARAAQALVARRLERRDERFLACARDLIFAVPQGALRRLLAWAGCTYADLDSAVRRDGLEHTLATLRDAGVRLSLDEVKGRAPIVRPGLEIATDGTSFDHPKLGGALAGRSSGSRGDASRVLYGWDFFAEEAADEMLLYASHDAVAAPTAFWMPGPPSVSGIHNLLVELKLRRTPRRFFSHLPPSPAVHAAIAGLRLVARPTGCIVPAIEAASSRDALHVARWMGTALGEGRGVVLKAFASSAIRVAAAAREHGVVLDGALFLTGGEPLTETRRRFLHATGAVAHARYVTTETGFVAGSCARDATGGTMHVYAERLALIAGEAVGEDAHRLLCTTLSPHNGKILLNADLGDSGRLLQRGCDCPLGHAGLTQHVTDVRARQRITLEGMTVADAVLDDAVARVVDQLGGAPDAYQLREEHGDDGLGRLTIAIGAALERSDATDLVERVLRELATRDPGAAIAARCWRDAGTLRVVRAEPQPTSGGKLPAGIRGARP